MKHPMQPIENIDNVARFKPNKIVQFILENSVYDLDVLGTCGFSDEDREQFAQLIGYSISAYCDLPYVSERSSHEAQLAEDELNPSNPYAHELSWVDEMNASCIADVACVNCQYSTTESIVHDKPCWFYFGSGSNSRTKFTDGRLDIVGVPCVLCRGTKVAPVKQLKA